MILLWDSSEMVCRFSLLRGNERYDYEWEAGRSLARDMLAYLRDRLAEHESTFQDLTGIGVFRGPGSFTGLRIGMTVLNTIACTQAIPIVGETDQAWHERALHRLASGDNDLMLLPEYGGEAHITRPRK